MCALLSMYYYILGPYAPTEFRVLLHRHGVLERGVQLCKCMVWIDVRIVSDYQRLQCARIDANGVWCIDNKDPDQFESWFQQNLITGVKVFVQCPTCECDEFVVFDMTPLITCLCVWTLSLHANCYCYDTIVIFVGEHQYPHTEHDVYGHWWCGSRTIASRSSGLHCVSGCNVGKPVVFAKYVLVCVFCVVCVMWFMSDFFFHHG